MLTANNAHKRSPVVLDGDWPLGLAIDQAQGKMPDLLILAFIVAGFAVATAYARFCDELARPAMNTGEDER